MTAPVYHVPVLFTEVMDGLNIVPDGTYLDCTLGGGGHFSGIHERLSSRGVLIGIDRDQDALDHVGTKFKKSPKSARVILEKSRFSDFDRVLKKHGISKINGVLADLGVSSHQIDAAER